MSPECHEGSILGLGNTPLHWRYWPAPDPSGSVFLIHGLGEHSGRYHHVAGRLAPAGLSVFSFDLRGHGLSGGSRGGARSVGELLDDVARAEKVWRARIPAEGGSFLFGHSLGGLLGLLHLGVRSGDFHGVALSAPWLRVFQPPWLRALGRLCGRIFPGLQLVSGLGPHRLTRDPAMAMVWEEDPLVHTRVTAGLFRAVERAQAALLRERGRWNGPPALFLLPGDDPVVSTPVAEEFARGFTGGEVQVEILEGRRHEPLNDLGREEVLDLLAGWITGHLPPGPDRGPWTDGAARV